MIMSNTDIKVTGTPQTYGEGATRNTKEGKGRFDLIPQEVFIDINNFLAERLASKCTTLYCHPLTIIEDIAYDRIVQAIVKLTLYSYSEEELDKPYMFPIDDYKYCCWDMLKDLAVHFQKGAEIYGERNCQKGIPAWSFKDSAMRHASQFFNEEEDEPHLISAIWNLWLLQWTYDTKKNQFNAEKEKLKKQVEEATNAGKVIVTAVQKKTNFCGNINIDPYKEILANVKTKISIEEDVEKNLTRMFRLLNMSVKIWLEEYITKNALDKYGVVEVSEEIEKRCIDFVLTFTNEDNNREYLYISIAERGEKNNKHFDVSIGEDYGFENCAFRLSVKLKDGLIQKNLIYFDDKEYNYCIEKEWMKRLEIIISAQTGLCCEYK
jgi:hypothetical protein